MMRSTFSTTTMASSTTMPIARISPSSVSMLSEKPKTSITPKVPISEMGTATIGMSVARQLCSERKTTRITSSSASNKRPVDVVDRLGNIGGHVERNLVADSLREILRGSPP